MSSALSGWTPELEQAQALSIRALNEPRSLRHPQPRDESRWPVPYWYIDTGFTALRILLAVVDEGLGAVFFGSQPGIMSDFRTR